MFEFFCSALKHVIFNCLIPHLRKWSSRFVVVQMGFILSIDSFIPWQHSHLGSLQIFEILIFVQLTVNSAACSFTLAIYWEAFTRFLHEPFLKTYIVGSPGSTNSKISDSFLPSDVIKLAKKLFIHRREKMKIIFVCSVFDPMTYLRKI